MAEFRLLTWPLLGAANLLAETWSAIRGEAPHTDVPPLEASLLAVLEAVLDRSFTLGVNLLSGVPNPAAIRLAREATQQAGDTIEAAGWLDDPVSFHPAPPPLEHWEESAHTGFQFTRRISYKTIRFESGYRPRPALAGEKWHGFTQNRDGYAYVLEHEEPSGRPWVVCVHGFGMGSPLTNFASFDVYRLHHELGLNVLMPVLPLHGPRAGGRTSGGEIMTSDFVNLVHFFTQAVWDIRRLLSWLRASGADRIGLWGVSLGGYTSALVAGLESDLECVIAGIPPTDFPNVARDNLPWIMRSFDPELATDWEAVRKMMHVVSPLTFEPRVAPDRRFIYAGIADRVVRPDQARALWRRWGEAQIRWFSGGHVAMQLKPGVLDFVEDALSASQMLPDLSRQEAASG